MLREFRDFAVKGNMVDMAVGIVIGGAFGAIVKSLVDDVIMPPIGLVTGGLDFSDLYFVLRDAESGGPYASLEAAREAGATVIAWGRFVNTLVAFLIVSAALFVVVKQLNRLRGPAPVTTKPCPFCTTTIAAAAKRCPACTSTL